MSAMVQTVVLPSGVFHARSRQVEVPRPKPKSTQFRSRVLKLIRHQCTTTPLPRDDHRCVSSSSRIGLIGFHTSARVHTSRSVSTVRSSVAHMHAGCAAPPFHSPASARHNERRPCCRCMLVKCRRHPFGAVLLKCSVGTGAPPLAVATLKRWARGSLQFVIEFGQQ